MAWALLSGCRVAKSPAGREDEGGAAVPFETVVEEMELLGALRFDAEGRVSSCNAAMGRVLGCAGADIRGAPLDRVLDAPDAAALLALLRDRRRYVAGRVRLAFRTGSPEPLFLECAIALDRHGGALLGRPLRPGE
jgi:PAS domain-containing protein